VIHQLGKWGQRWARSEMGPDDLDVALLMWDIHVDLAVTADLAALTKVWMGDVGFADAMRARLVTV
jgi:hypothetical protein